MSEDALQRDYDLRDVFSGLSLRYRRLACEFERTPEVLHGKSFDFDMNIPPLK
jgi:hypothetical protein